MYGFPGLLPGQYEVHAEAAGFQRIARAATVEAGTTTRADLVLRVGDLTDSVTVEAASSQIRYDSASVSGLITHDQLQALPLNGRNFLELASLNRACRLQQLPIAIARLYRDLARRHPMSVVRASPLMEAASRRWGSAARKWVFRRNWCRSSRYQR